MTVAGAAGNEEDGRLGQGRAAIGRWTELGEDCDLEKMAKC